MSTVIEAGHYYGAVGPSTVDILGWEVGKQHKAATGGQLVLFVDDYHQQNQIDGEGEYFGSAMQAILVDGMHQEADAVFSEALLAVSSPEEVAKLLDDKLVKTRKGVVSAAGVRLGCLRRRKHRYIHANLRVSGLFAA